MTFVRSLRSRALLHERPRVVTNVDQLIQEAQAKAEEAREWHAVEIAEAQRRERVALNDIMAVCTMRSYYIS